LKTKKILAIVTLVAFMISILPMAAFAAATQYGSYVVEVATEAQADSSDELEYDIFVRAEDLTAGFGAGAKIYVATDRGAIDTIVIDEDDLTSSTGTQWVNVTVKSAVASTGKIAFGLVSPEATAGYLADDDAHTAATAKIIGGKAYNFTFTPADANMIGLSATTGTVYANGSSYREITAIVTASGIPVAGEKVSFKLNKAGATLSANEVTTNTKGEAKVKVFATKPADDYIVTAELSDDDDVFKTITVAFTAISVVDIKAESDNNQKIASGVDLDLEYSFYDSLGNKLTSNLLDTDYVAADGNFKNDTLIEGSELRVITAPSGALIDDKPQAAAVTFTNDGGNLKMTIDADYLDKEGNYSIKLSLTNGKSVTYDFTIKDQGDIVAMTISYDTASLSENGISGNPTVKLKDAEGYAKTMSNSDTDLSFAIDRADLAFISSIGVLTVKNGADPGVVTVTAINSEENLVAATTIKVTKAPSALKVTAPSYTAAGETAEVTVQLVDIDGNPVAGGVPTAVVTADAIVIGKPSGSIVSAENGVTVSSDFAESGKFTLDVTSNSVGAVTIQVLAKVTAGSTYTGSAVVNFGTAAAAKQGLTMFIGSKNYMLGNTVMISDTTPFIQNGRTFVAVRPIGEALGAAIGWNEATQTVTLSRPGEVLTIVIGASTIKVDRAGVVTEYPCDAPAQIVAGRTYLPFRCIGEACGYVVSYDGATGAVSFK